MDFSPHRNGMCQASPPLQPEALWVRSRYPISLSLLLIFYAVGVIGMLGPFAQAFVELTCANLMLTAALLLLNERSFDRRVAWSFAVSTLVGYLAEVVGVKTGMVFGAYHYTDHMGPRLFEVPLVIGVNWAVLVYAVHAGVTHRIPSRLLAAATGASVMTAFDWVMEPSAIRLGYWVWHSSSIPLRNYAAWWVLSFLLQLLARRWIPSPRNPLARWVLLVMLSFFSILRWSPA